MSEQPEAEDVAKEDVGRITIETVLSLLTASPLSVIVSITSLMAEKQCGRPPEGVLREQYVVM